MISDTLKGVIFGGLLGLISGWGGLFIQSYIDELQDKGVAKEEIYAETRGIQETLRNSLYNLMESKLDVDYWTYRFKNLTPTDPKEHDQQNLSVEQFENDRNQFSIIVADLYRVKGKIRSIYRLTDKLKSATNDLFLINELSFKYKKIDENKKPAMTELDQWLSEERARVFSNANEQVDDRFKLLIEELENQLLIN